MFTKFYLLPSGCRFQSLYEQTQPVSRFVKKVVVIQISPKAPIHRTRSLYEKIQPFWKFIKKVVPMQTSHTTYGRSPSIIVSLDTTLFVTSQNGCAHSNFARSHNTSNPVIVWLKTTVFEFRQKGCAHQKLPGCEFRSFDWNFSLCSQPIYEWWRTFVDFLIDVLSNWTSTEMSRHRFQSS